MEIVKVEQITKKFGNFTALDHINLTIKEGEILGFIGPNGAGKTTTIRILLGLIKATSGSAFCFGKDVFKDAVEIHKKLAYVPGDVNLWSNLTGGEVIDLFLKMNHNYDKKKRDMLIEKFDLDPSKKCRTYSKGNRQKVALVSAFASNAQLFILDEPTSGLDPLMEKVFQDCIMEVKKSGKSVLLSSHILSEVEKLCDNISIIRQGKIIETGTLKHLRHLTRVHVYVETKDKIKKLNELSGIFELKEEGNTYKFQADIKEMSSIMSYISNYSIVRIESTPQTLEELFMSHYES